MLMCVCVLLAVVGIVSDCVKCTVYYVELRRVKCGQSEIAVAFTAGCCLL